MFQYTKLDIAGVNKAIVSIRSQSAKVDQMLVDASCSILDHLKVNGDTTLPTKLVQALGRAHRAKALIFWFEYHSPITWDAKEKLFRIKKGWQKLEGAFREPECAFYDFSPEKDPAPFSLQKFAAAVLRKLEKEGTKFEDLQKVVAEMA